MLLIYGMRAVQSGRADNAPYLSTMMFDGHPQASRIPRPAPFDNGLLRRWVDFDEDAALTFIRHQLGHFRASSTSTERLEMLAQRDCLTEQFGPHRLTTEQFAQVEDNATWAVGWRTDCVRALLWRYDDDPNTIATTWPFYDHDAPEQ